MASLGEGGKHHLLRDAANPFLANHGHPGQLIIFAPSEFASIKSYLTLVSRIACSAVLHRISFYVL